MLTKWMLTLLAVATLTLTACHGHLKHHHSPGHDPDGPGNSENAPGHNK
jgi:hypothetical protein